MLTNEIATAVAIERDRQRALWNRPHAWGYGDCSHDLQPPVKLAVLLEEVGEVARAVLEQSPADLLRDELIQVVAVATAWLEGL